MHICMNECSYLWTSVLAKPHGGDDQPGVFLFLFILLICHWTSNNCDSLHLILISHQALFHIKYPPKHVEIDPTNIYIC